MYNAHNMNLISEINGTRIVGIFSAQMSKPQRRELGNPINVFKTGFLFVFVTCTILFIRQRDNIVSNIFEHFNVNTRWAVQMNYLEQWICAENCCEKHSKSLMSNIFTWHMPAAYATFAMSAITIRSFQCIILRFILKHGCVRCIVLKRQKEKQPCWAKEETQWVVVEWAERFRGNKTEIFGVEMKAWGPWFSLIWLISRPHLNCRFFSKNFVSTGQHVVDMFKIWKQGINHLVIYHGWQYFL